MSYRLRHASLSTWIARGVLFGVLWWAIAEGRPVSWPFVVLGVAAATAGSVALWPAAPWRLRGLMHFGLFFLTQSVRGGVDVSLRALLPWGRVRPGFERRELTLEDPQARLLMTNALSLLPGTLSARLDDGRLVVHLLDMESEARRSIDLLESHVAGLIGPRAD
jgi:multicomponent Na+:H+ antiporter subunit E